MDNEYTHKERYPPRECWAGGLRGAISRAAPPEPFSPVYVIIRTRGTHDVDIFFIFVDFQGTGNHLRLKNINKKMGESGVKTR